jgi:two-component system, NarL family, nitrate/nitrite sensor histidine kinase NarX
LRPPPTLSAKLVLTGTALLLLALASIGLTLWVTWNLQGGAAAVNEAGRMRMQTYRMALDIASGAPAPEVAAAARGFDDSLNLLAQGDPSRPLFVPWSTESRERFEDVRLHWQALRERWASQVPPVSLRAEADAFVARVDGFVAAIETQIARWTAVLHAFQLVLVGLAIASAVVMFYAGYLFVLNPLARLKRGLAALQAGELGTRIEVGSRDEFGELADGFNEMAQTLQSLYAGLEEKVRAKTLDLERERQRLADLYQVSAFVAKAPSLEALAQGFARQVRRIAHADAAAVRWSDEGRQCYLLLAQDQLPEELARSESCVETGSCLCGAAALDTRTRVVPIAAADGAPALRCRRAGFATVACVPVRLHEKVLAEVDLFYREPVALGEEERGLLDALASHLAGAMEALRAGAMEREAAVAQERGLLARELHDSIAQSLAFLKIQVQLLRQAAQRRDTQGLERIVAELDAGVRESQADVRELLLHFRTRASEEDIEPALRTTLQKFEHQTGLAAQLRIEGRGLPPLPQDVQVQVLHIVQEALSNVRKHAGARHVELRVSPAPHWRFEIRDDGAGFEPDDPRGQTHVGLDIMRERAERIGARVRVRSAPGAGCTVLLELTAAGPDGAHAEPAEAAA